MSTDIAPCKGGENTRYPFTPELLDALPEELCGLFRGLELWLLDEICSRLRAAGQLNEVTVQSIRALRAHGIGLADIQKAIAEASGTGMDRLNALLDDVAWRNQDYYTGLVDAARVTAPERLIDERDVDAIRRQAADDFRNITRSMGFVVNGGRTLLPPARAYQWALDQAALQVQSGAAGYHQAIAAAVRQLADSGLKTVGYESGHADSVDVAVRRAVMTGVNALNQRYREQSMDYLDTDLVEVTAHAGARDVDGPNGWENHKKWQGRVYRYSEKPCASNGEYPDFERACGYGSVTGIGGANCRHSFWPFIEGVSERTWTDEQLRHIDDGLGCEFEGKRYSAYEATQMQRRLENSIRRQKRRRTAFEAAGLTEDAQAAGIRLRRLHEKYREFSKAAGLPQQRERLRALALDKAPAPLEAPPESGILKTNIPEGILKMNKAAASVSPTEDTVGETRASPVSVIEEYLRDAMPGQGNITYDSGYDIQQHQQEVRFSKWLHDTFGGDIRMLNEANEQLVKTADYLWKNKLWDLKTATTEKAANAAIRHGLKQIRENPGGIFLDYRGTEIDLNVLASVIQKRLQWRKDPSAVDIMIVLDDGVQVWRY